MQRRGNLGHHSASRLLFGDLRAASGSAVFPNGEPLAACPFRLDPGNLRDSCRTTAVDALACSSATCATSTCIRHSGACRRLPLAARGFARAPGGTCGAAAGRTLRTPLARHLAPHRAGRSDAPGASSLTFRRTGAALGSAVFQTASQIARLTSCGRTAHAGRPAGCTHRRPAAIGAGFVRLATGWARTRPAGPRRAAACGTARGAPPPRTCEMAACARRRVSEIAFRAHFLRFVARAHPFSAPFGPPPARTES